MPLLKEVSIYNCTRCILEAMLLTFQRSPFVQKLSICGCDFNEGDLCSIVSFCPNLKEFNLDIPEQFLTLIGGDVLASCIARHCSKLQSLSLEGLGSMSDNGLLAILKIHAHQLKRLQLKNCSLLTENSLIEISKCHGLKKLTFSKIPSLNDRILFGTICKIANTLEFLQLESLPISDIGIQNISKFGISLKQLRLYDLHLLTDIGFLAQDEANQLSKLKQLILHGSPALSNPKSINKFGVPLLERLELVGCLSIDESLLNDMILQFTKLKRIIYAGPHASEEFQKSIISRFKDCNFTFFCPQSPE